MARENDWLIGEYFVYAFDDVDGEIFNHPCSVTHPDGGNNLTVLWNFGPDFQYAGELSLRGDYFHMLSKRTNHEEFVYTIFPKPKTNHLNLVWGIAIGTIPRGNMPAIFRLVISRRRLPPGVLKQEFKSMNATAQNSISVIDYDVEEKNRR